MLIICLGSIFAWTCCNTISKYLAKKTAVQLSHVDNGTVLFPSITFCKKYTFDTLSGIIQPMRNNKAMTEADARSWAMNHVWRRNDMFHFLSHNDKQFPCTTIGPYKIGRPCVFPFNYPDCSMYSTSPFICLRDPKQPMRTFYKCKEGSNGEPWCATRTYNNMTYVTGLYSNSLHINV